MKVSIGWVLLFVALFFVSLGCVVVSEVQGEHTTTYYLPDGQTVTIQTASNLGAVDSNGDVLLSTVTDDNRTLFWSAFTGLVVFGICFVVAISCLDD